MVQVFHKRQVLHSHKVMFCPLWLDNPLYHQAQVHLLLVEQVVRLFLILQPTLLCLLQEEAVVDIIHMLLVQQMQML